MAFPLPIMALVPLRRYLLPCLFKPAHLAQLDAAEYEAAPPVDPAQQDNLVRVAAGAGGPHGQQQRRMRHAQCIWSP